MKKFIPQKLKNYYHLLQAILANVWYGFPSRHIKIIGVTGTNGKTTTTQMIGRILEEAGHCTAVASTINFKIGQKEWVNKTKFTTLSSFAVQKFIRQAVDAKCEYAVLETSSHALDQNRVWGVAYDTAVMTNVTREHLDYHKNMEQYRIAKLKLFARIKKAVVNFDMEDAEDYLDAPASKKYAFTTKAEAEIENEDDDRDKIKLIKAMDVELEINQSRFKVGGVQFELKMPGLFNVENALAAICVGVSVGVPLEKMSVALAKMTGVPGRMEHIQNDRGINIIVDYAVTPDSLEKLYTLISQIKHGPKRTMELSEAVISNKVIAVFGSCGDRDRGKRPLMGAIVDKNSDYAIVTNEDPYTEDPQQIIDEVAAGIIEKKENENFWKIMDRRAAIRKALQLAASGDVIVVTGKGAEETMMVGDKQIPWNDKKVILEELSEPLIRT
ncbi:MAG: UDP-N-acetylmuramoyl-L-alanyl-D-glutamate--2,6-diaminopimelate ligase [Parcubacteria group bacterium]